MTEQQIYLGAHGTATLPGYAHALRLGYAKNQGVYRLRVNVSEEWQGLTLRAHWHVPGGDDPAATLVVDGVLDVPASVTARSGDGCITFEGSDGSKTVTSADVRYLVGSNSGTDDGTMPEPNTPAWEAFLRQIGAGVTSEDNWECLSTITSDGTLGSVAYTEHPLRKYRIYVTIPDAADITTSMGVEVYKSGTLVGYHWVASMVQAGKATSAKVWGGNADGEFVSWCTATSASTANQAVAAQVTPQCIEGVEPVTQVGVYLSGSNAFPEGSVIEIWGVKHEEDL